MKKSDFNAKYNEEFQCVVTYLNGFDMVVKGVALSGVVSKPKGKPYVCVDSMVQKIPLTRIIKINPTNKKWD